MREDDKTVWIQRGLVYQDMGNHELAIEDFNKAIELKADFSKSWFHRATSKLQAAYLMQSQEKQNKIDEALEDFQRALELDPDGENPGILDGPASINKLLEQKPAASTIDDILKNLNLIKYSYCFQNINLEEFKQLSDKDLKDLGISLIGPRRKLSSAIASLDITKNQKSEC